MAEASAFDDGQARRVFHGRGGCYPGLEWMTVDDFGDGLWIVLFREPEPEQWQSLIETLAPIRPLRGYACIQHRYERPVRCEWIWGEAPEPPVAREGELEFALQLGGRQNTGYFMDAQPGRDWLRSRCEGRSVLNLFSYTCAFSVAARAAGAERVVNVDMAKAALRTGRDNHRLNGQSMQGVEFLGYDIFRSWKRIRSLGPYDVLVVDPPSFQKGSFDARKDYARILRRIPELTEGKAELLLCLNAPYLSREYFLELVTSELPSVEVEGFLDGRADFPEASEPALKMLHCRI
nr:class I SAM-dependent methyltransferase [Litorivivens lipolytica]